MRKHKLGINNLYTHLAMSIASTISALQSSSDSSVLSDMISLIENYSRNEKSTSYYHGKYEEIMAKACEAVAAAEPKRLEEIIEHYGMETVTFDGKEIQVPPATKQLYNESKKELEDAIDEALKLYKNGEWFETKMATITVGQKKIDRGTGITAAILRASDVALILNEKYYAISNGAETNEYTVKTLVGISRVMLMSKLDGEITPDLTSMCDDLLKYLCARVRCASIPVLTYAMQIQERMDRFDSAHEKMGIISAFGEGMVNEWLPGTKKFTGEYRTWDLPEKCFTKTDGGLPDGMHYSTKIEFDPDKLVIEDLSDITE
jgi:hypothetical protein